MTLLDHHHPFRPRLGLVAAALFVAAPVLAQDGRPGPTPPTPSDPAVRALAQDAPARSGTDRPRSAPPGQSKLAFDDHPINGEVFAFIAEMTGKVVMPMNLVTIETKKFTLINDEYIPNDQALDLIFQAFRLNDIGVIEKEDVIIIGSIDQIIETRQLPVLTADEDIMARRDRGSLAMKIYRLTEVNVEDVVEQLGEGLPSYARLNADPNSNQIILVGDIALCQHLQQVIDELDTNYLKAETRTFRLAYADASAVADNILELFETSGQASGSNQPARRTNRATQRGQNPTTPMVGPVIELRVTVNGQQNSLTVVADPARMEQVSDLIVNEWDLPRSPGTQKIYTLRYTDPLKVADILNNLLNQGGGGTSSARRTTGGRTAGAAGGGVDEALQGIYRIEASPESNQIVVLCKTEQSLDFLDALVAEYDQPSTIGLPFVIELKHASAIDLAEELNALLAEAGAGADISLPDEGLGGRQASEDGSTTGTDGGGSNRLSFPWQRGGRARDDQSPESQLIGKVRIVPITRRNALAVLCPAPQREAVAELITNFDKPGRQVMIQALIAEVELNDALSLGVRFSSGDDLASSSDDFLVAGTSSQSGSIADALGDFFDTSLLDLAFDVNVVIQALAQKTNVRILQQPTIFTADNQEALFFDGQDIPFIENSTINTQGNPTDSFSYREVGVILNVRPRITVQRDVDLEILLELSSIVPGQTLFGGAIVDRRETTTHVVLKNRQTVVISGIIREEESKIERKIPLLGDIPLIGELFKSRENSLIRSELIAFITPYVVDDPSENDTNFQQDFRDRLEKITRPVDEQLRQLDDDPEMFRDRLIPGDVKDSRSYRERLDAQNGDPIGGGLLGGGS